MLKPVYALVGDDSFLQLEQLSSLLAQAPRDVQRIDVDGERAELAEVFDELRSFAMFGGSKIVVMRNADAFLTRFREPLENYVSAPASGAVLILRLSSLPSNQRIYKAIKKTGDVIPCEPPKDLVRWIVDRAKQVHKLAVAPDAARTLADLIGKDLGKLDSELAKLALQSSSGKIGAQDIAGSVAFQREQEMYDLTNAMAAGNAAEAVRKWRQLVQMDSSAEFRAVTWLAMWLENVRKALAMKKQGMQLGAIASALRIWQRDLQQPFMKTAETLGDAGVARAVDLLAEIDQQSKSGVGNAADNVERFILSVAPAVPSRR